MYTLLTSNHSLSPYSSSSHVPTQERNRQVNGIYDDPDYETMMLLDEEVKLFICYSIYSIRPFIQMNAFIDTQALYMTQHDLAYISDPNGQRVSAEELWKVICERNPCFPCKYRVYIYFKEAG